METIKNITREEAVELLGKIGHMAKVTTKVKHTVAEGITEEEDKCVLNDSWVYNPFYGGKGVSSDNTSNAEKAIGFIEKGNSSFTVYSSYFKGVNGIYRLV